MAAQSRPDLPYSAQQVGVKDDRMSKWTRRDLVKPGLAASAGMVPGGDSLAGPAETLTPPGRNPMHAAAAVHGAAPTGLRERLSMDFGWWFALGNANDPDKDFGFGKLRREYKPGGGPNQCCIAAANCLMRIAYP